jgi:serine acetyltransferase
VNPIVLWITVRATPGSTVTGKERGDRHPKVRDGVLLYAGAKVLGNFEIGRDAKVGAGSVVCRTRPQVRSRLAAGAKGIRTAGPTRMRYIGKRMPPLSLA